MIRTGRGAGYKHRPGPGLTKQEYLAEFRRRRQEAFRELKSQPCVDCERRYPSYVMDFDHVPERGKKLFAVGSKAMASKWADVLAEIEKCDLVCANCHRVRTHSRRALP